MVGLSDPKCWLGDPGTCFWVTRKNISNTGADQLCRSSWNCCAKLKPLKRPQFRQKISANFGAWQVPNVDPNWSLLCPTAIYAMCQLCWVLLKMGDSMGSPRNGNFQREHCDFQHGIVIFCRESLIIDDRDSDGDGLLLRTLIIIILSLFWRSCQCWWLDGGWQQSERFGRSLLQSLLSICNVLTRSG